MTHKGLGVALGLLLELLLLVLLKATDGRGEKTTGSDAGRHCDCCVWWEVLVRFGVGGLRLELSGGRVLV